MKLLDKWIKRLIILAAIVLAVWLFFPKLHLVSSIENWLKPKPVLIENTPLLINQVKNIALLNTAIFAQDIVMDTVVNTPSKYAILNLPFTPLLFSTTEKKEIVLVIQGKVTAGIDLKNLPDSAIFASDDSVCIKLPSSKIIDVFVNPSGVETFYESGTWTNEETKHLLMGAEQKLIKAAINYHLIATANEKAKMVMQQFLFASGFKKITIIMKNY